MTICKWPMKKINMFIRDHVINMFITIDFGIKIFPRLIVVSVFCFGFDCNELDSFIV